MPMKHLKLRIQHCCFPFKPPSRPKKMVQHLRYAALQNWHKFLHLPRQSSVLWHRARLREELAELRNAKTSLSRLSEAADVAFSISRARFDGHALRISVLEMMPAGVLLYMVVKFSLRWCFYRLVAFACGSRGRQLGAVREVVNPRKMSKIDEVAGRHGLDPRLCRMWARKMMMFWPLLP